MADGPGKITKKIMEAGARDDAQAVNDGIVEIVDLVFGLAERFVVAWEVAQGVRPNPVMPGQLYTAGENVRAGQAVYLDAASNTIRLARAG